MTRFAQSFVFTGLINNSGWDSIVIAWFLGLLQSAFAFIGFDAVIHISEEMPDPGREGPKVLLMTIVVGAIFGVITLMCVLFGIQDLTGVLGTSTG